MKYKRVRKTSNKKHNKRNKRTARNTNVGNNSQVNYESMTIEQLVAAFHQRANKHFESVVRAGCGSMDNSDISEMIGSEYPVIAHINMLLYRIDRKYTINLLKAQATDFKDFLSLCISVDNDIKMGKTDLDLTEIPVYMYGIKQPYSLIDKYYINKYDMGVYETEKYFLPLFFGCYQKIGPAICFSVGHLDTTKHAA